MNPPSTFQRLKAILRKSQICRAIFYFIRQIKHFIQSPEAFKMSEDERYFYQRHKDIFGYKANFKKPQTFNEKIIHRILYDRNPIYTYLADKLKARIYIAHKLQGFTQNNIGAREREREQRNLKLS